MNCHIWTSQGAETHVSGETADKVCSGFQFKQCARIEAVGKSGGILLLWNGDSTELEILTLHDHFIHARIVIQKEPIHLIIIHSPPTVARRRSFWEDLEQEVRDITEPPFMGGDYNCILSIEERQGGSGKLSSDSEIFQD
ncbi:hypothetical protein V2J09_014856 [Rumex salicifolius]